MKVAVVEGVLVELGVNVFVLLGVKVCVGVAGGGAHSWTSRTISMSP